MTKQRYNVPLATKASHWVPKGIVFKQPEIEFRDDRTPIKRWMDDWITAMRKPQGIENAVKLEFEPFYTPDMSKARKRYLKIQCQQVTRQLEGQRFYPYISGDPDGLSYEKVDLVNGEMHFDFSAHPPT